MIILKLILIWQRSWKGETWLSQITGPRHLVCSDGLSHCQNGANYRDLNILFVCYTVKKQCNHYNSVNHNISYFWYEKIGYNLSTSVKSFRINFHEKTGVALVKQVWASSLWWEAWDSGTSWLSGIVWLIIIRPQQLNSLVFTDQGHLIFKGLHPSDCSVPCSRPAGSLKALPDGRPSLGELCLRSFSQFYYVMAGGFYPPIFKSTRRFGGWAGGWLIHCI